MIFNPVLWGDSQGEERIIGTCTMRDLSETDQTYPIYQGVAPIGSWVAFPTYNNVVQQNGHQAECAGYLSMRAGDYMLYCGVKDGDHFKEEAL